MSDPQRTLSAPILTPSELHLLGLAEEFHTKEMQQRSLPRTASVDEFGHYGALLATDGDPNSYWLSVGRPDALLTISPVKRRE